MTENMLPDVWTSQDNFPEIGNVIRTILSEHCAEIVRAFYSVFLNNPEASRFLTHQAVHDRLEPSLNRWLRSLFIHYPPQVDEKAQQTIGAVHARLGIPIHLVLEGASLIKDAIGKHLASQVSALGELGVGMRVVDRTIDLAMQKMSAAYVVDTKRYVVKV